MNDLDLCLEVISRSRQQLRYIWRWISRKPLEIEAWFQRSTNRKWYMGYRMVTDDVTWPWKVNLVTPIRLERNTSKTAWARGIKFGRQLCMGIGECRAGAQKIFPENRRGLGHVTPTIFGIWSNVSPKLLELESSNLVRRFVWRMPSRRTNSFPSKWASAVRQYGRLS